MVNEYKVNITIADCGICGGHTYWTCPKCGSEEKDYGEFYSGWFTDCESCEAEYDILKVKSRWFKAPIATLLECEKEIL